MRTDPQSVCVLVSGGLDSAVLLYRLLDGRAKVTPLYLRCGLRWEPAEIFWLRRFLHAIRAPNLAPLQMIELPMHSLYHAHWSVSGQPVPGAGSPDTAVYMPGRNILLLSAAAIRCAEQQLTLIAVGLLKGNPFGDASNQFLHHASRCLSAALGHPIHIEAPLKHMDKSRLVRSAGRIPLGLTFSCLDPRGRRHCGRCNKCAERRRAFRDARVPDPAPYAAR